MGKSRVIENSPCPWMGVVGMETFLPLMEMGKFYLPLKTAVEMEKTCVGIVDHHSQMH